MSAAPIIAAAVLETLRRDPEAQFEGILGGTSYTARVAIPDHGDNVAQYYGAAVRNSVVPLQFPHFGTIIEFANPTELSVYDENRVLENSLREIVEAFGPLTLRNAYLPERSRRDGQRNIFPSLRFHFDRGATQEDRYSLFWRDPFDEAHHAPRSSSTLFVVNAVAYLQACREGDCTPELKPLYEIFGDDDLDGLIGKIVLEQGWRAPAGTGEISILDNRSVLHASYYAEPENRGYPIGVRYLF